MSLLTYCYYHYHYHYHCYYYYYYYYYYYWVPGIRSIFQSFLERPNNNWYLLCFRFLHFGDFMLEVFILREFPDYLNGCISVRWDCHIYHMAFLSSVMMISDICYLRHTSVIAIDFLSQHPSPNQGLWQAKRVSTWWRGPAWEGGL